MPFFKTVGHIDDNLSQEEIMKEYRRRYTLAAYRRRRAALIAQLGGTCDQCGATEALNFARKPGAPESLRVNGLATMSKNKLTQSLMHVRLLCEEHLRTELYGKNQVTHGTWYSAYKKKCRCDDCGEFMADYNLRRQEDRKYARHTT